MNRRIKELAEKAKLEHCVSHVRLQEFADLIIDECCTKLLEMDMYTMGNHNYYKHAAVQIKEHFKAIND